MRRTFFMNGLAKLALCPQAFARMTSTYVGTSFIHHQFIKNRQNGQISASDSFFSAVSKQHLEAKESLCKILKRYTIVVVPFPELCNCLLFFSFFHFFSFFDFFSFFLFLLLFCEPHQRVEWKRLKPN